MSQEGIAISIEGTNQEVKSGLFQFLSLRLPDEGKETVSEFRFPHPGGDYKDLDKTDRGVEVVENHKVDLLKMTIDRWEQREAFFRAKLMGNLCLTYESEPDAIVSSRSRDRTTNPWWVRNLSRGLPQMDIRVFCDEFIDERTQTPLRQTLIKEYRTERKGWWLHVKVADFSVLEAIRIEQEIKLRIEAIRGRGDLSVQDAQHPCYLGMLKVKKERDEVKEEIEARWESESSQRNKKKLKEERPL